jgi:hypothetical protein
LPPTQFDHEARFDLFSSEAWALAKGIAGGVGIPGAEQPIPICHATLRDGSEQDLWVHCGGTSDSAILIEVRHHYIDQHLLLYHLWRSDREQDPTYPVELFLDGDVISESISGGSKALEFFVRPVTLLIHARSLDISRYLPTDEARARCEKMVAVYPIFQLWRLFEADKFDEAGTVAREILRSKSLGKGINGPFWHSVAGLCAYRAEQFLVAVEHFLKSAVEYTRAAMVANADVSLFSALEAGRNISDMNKSLDVARQIIDAFCLHSNAAARLYKEQLVNIVKSYYTHSGDYVGPTVECRRVVELYLSQALEAKFGTLIRQQIEAAKAAREISKKAGIGCNAVIQLAAAKRMITDEERRVALHIKDFGNKIHDRAGVGTAIDARYAMQSCLHLLRREIT